METLKKIVDRISFDHETVDMDGHEFADIPQETWDELKEAVDAHNNELLKIAADLALQIHHENTSEGMQRFLQNQSIKVSGLVRGH